jgi:phage tail sheath gpL-like
MSSDILGAGCATNQYRNNAEKKGEVIDLEVVGLPDNASAQALKKIASVKHVISTTVEEDNIRGACTGNGRIKIRLGADETADDVKLRFLQAGLSIKDHQINPKKQSGFTEG